MQLGFPVLPFTIGNATLGVIGGNSYIGGTLLGVDVSPYVLSVSTTRGRPDQLANFTAGSASIELNNADRRFDPINESSPYWDATEGRTGIVPRRKVTVKCDGDPIFVGRITDVDVSYQPTRTSATVENSTVTVTAADDFAVLANTFIETALVPSEELSGARVSAVLDLPTVDFPAATRDIAAGVAVLGGGAAYTVDAGTNALTYLQEIATAEQGLFFIDRSGYVTFVDRVEPAFASAVLTLADDGTGIDYQNIDVVYGSEFLYNRVSCTRVGGTEQVVDDAASQAEFGIITLSLDNLLVATDAAALAIANLLLERYAWPEYRFDRPQVIMNNKTGVQRGQVNQVEIGETVDVVRTFRTGTPAAVTQPYVIEGVRHSITPSSHLVTFSMSATSVIYPFIIGDAVYGVIGTTNAVS